MAGALGNVGGLTNIVKVALTVQAAAYATGNLLGGKHTITNAVRAEGETAILQSVVIASKSDLTIDLDLLLFDADPAATTFTERAALAVDPADAFKVLGPITINTRVDIGTPVIASLRNIGLPVKPAGASRNLYGALIARGNYTPGSTSDLQIIYGFDGDA